MWYEGLERNFFISKLYSQIPELVNVRIYSLKILDEGDRITLSFDMPLYADKPPEKWVNQGYNKVFVEIDFFDVHELWFKSDERRYRGDVKIVQDTGGMFTVEINGTVQAKIKASVGVLQSVNGYLDGIE